MARTRTGEQLIDDTYRRADVEGETERHPRTDVLRYVNQGVAELYDLLVAARGRSYYRSATPWTITTTADTLLYTSGYPSAFYQLIGVRLAGDVNEPLSPLAPMEEASLADENLSVTYPTHYDLRPTGLALFPRHAAGLSVVVDYVPNITDLSDSSGSTFDGINGWEEYAVCFAALCIATKDDEPGLAAALDRRMAQLRTRIAQLAPQRDRARARRVQDIRGPRLLGTWRRTF